MMGMGSSPGTVGVLVPDFSFWGNEGALLSRVSDGKGIPGWAAQLSHLKVCGQSILYRSSRALAFFLLLGTHGFCPFT